MAFRLKEYKTEYIKFRIENAELAIKKMSLFIKFWRPKLNFRGIHIGNIHHVLQQKLKNNAKNAGL